MYYVLCIMYYVLWNLSYCTSSSVGVMPYLYFNVIISWQWHDGLFTVVDDKYHLIYTSNNKIIHFNVASFAHKTVGFDS
jgi:hypothetical protein